MHKLETKTVVANGVKLHCQAMGQGPMVLFCHGWPGLAFSWRHQLAAVAEAGFMAVALDTRGYGQSDRPGDVADYSYDHQVADMLAVMAAFSAEKMVMVGHDFGANLAWHMALRCPEKLHAVVSVSVPYQMPLACGTPEQKPSELFAAIASQHFFHMHYFQTLGIAEAEFAGQEDRLLQKLFWALSADGNLLNWENYPMEGTGYLDVLQEPAQQLPWSWMSSEDFRHYLDAFLVQGADKAFVGGLSAYRVLDINYEINKPYLGGTVEIPAFFVAGAEDPVISLTPQETWDVMAEKVPQLFEKCVLPEAGHFVQQEKPDELNSALLRFLSSLALT